MSSWTHRWPTPGSGQKRGWAVSLGAIISFILRRHLYPQAPTLWAQPHPSWRWCFLFRQAKRVSWMSGHTEVNQDDHIHTQISKSHVWSRPASSFLPFHPRRRRLLPFSSCLLWILLIDVTVFLIVLVFYLVLQQMNHHQKAALVALSQMRTVLCSASWHISDVPRSTPPGVRWRPCVWWVSSEGSASSPWMWRCLCQASLRGLSGRENIWIWLAAVPCSVLARHKRRTHLSKNCF